MKGPDLLDARIMALQKKVYGDRGKETREAVPIPLALVAALERFVAARFRTSQFHVVGLDHDILVPEVRRRTPRRAGEKLVMKDEALYRAVWQTKVERQKKGTRFAAAKVSVSGENWMEEGWSAASFQMDDRDYFLKELESADRFADRPTSYIKEAFCGCCTCSRPRPRTI